LLRLRRLTRKVMSSTGLSKKNAKILRDVKKVQFLTLEDVALDTMPQLYKMRKEQYAMYKNVYTLK